MIFIVAKGFVRKLPWILAGCLAAAQSAGPAPRAPLKVVPPAWAYPVNPPNMAVTPATDAPIHVSGSDTSFRPAQLADLFEAPDWHPSEHPPMPEIVARGRRPDVYACGYCHLPDGAGRPENADLAGLPADYIVRELAAFANGSRRSAVNARVPPQLMMKLARSATSADIAAAAQYFAALPPRPSVNVVETNTVPHTYVAGWFLAADGSKPSEPIGRRIIEVPEDLEQFEHRDSHSRFTAYVPIGSLTLGKELVTAGRATGVPACTGCHGADLKGVGAVPRIAGRSPSYIVRQLFDIQSGSHAGSEPMPMAEVVEHLRVDDMIAIAAYLATR